VAHFKVVKTIFGNIENDTIAIWGGNGANYLDYVFVKPISLFVQIEEKCKQVEHLRRRCNRKRTQNPQQSNPNNLPKCLRKYFLRNYPKNMVS